MIPAKPFYMIRHGETVANAAKMMAGHLDSPLNETGRAQARAVQEIVVRLQVKPAAIIHSNLSRARDTAAIINEVLNLPMQEDADIAEHFCGELEGRPYEECRGMIDGWQTPPGGESFDDFCTRIARSKTRALNAHTGPVLIVSHGGVFRGLGKIYGLNTPGIFKNCQLYEFAPDTTQAKFPWKVWHYHPHGREESRIFHDSEEIA